MIKNVSDSIETSRLIIADAKMDECDSLQRIGESWHDKVFLEGEAFESGYIHRCITEGDLPPIPSASKQNYRLKSIFLKEKRVLIGFVDLYLGYPNEHTAWISILVLDKNFQGNGYAKELMEGISHECTIIEYKKIGIGVYLKNWRALRFWTRMGFNKITGISGDTDYSEDAFAIIKLEKNIQVDCNSE